MSGASADPNSTAIVDAFDETVAAEEQARQGPSINTTEYSDPLYTVPANQPTVQVKLEHTPAEPTLQAAWNEVPLPPEAEPALGHDHMLLLWQPSTERLWEFWHLTHEANGWHASWGGAMQHLSSDTGAYDPEVWPGAQGWWGASASSISLLGGLITLKDLESGKIEHALAMSIPNVRAGVYAAPAQRTDGKSTSLLALPEGARLRLPPSLNLEDLHLPHLTLLIARAAQRYGIIVTDGGSNVIFPAQDPAPTGTEPYRGVHGYFEGKTPQQLLVSFPWNELELVKMELREKG